VAGVFIQRSVTALKAASIGIMMIRFWWTPWMHRSYGRTIAIMYDFSASMKQTMTGRWSSPIETSCWRYADSIRVDQTYLYHHNKPL
jgi:hypothetical protein